MHPTRTSWKPSSRYATTVRKLFQGLRPAQISPNETEHQFWHTFFSLGVDKDFLSSFLTALSKDECLHTHKSVLHTLFVTCVEFAGRNGNVRDGRVGEDDILVRSRAVETLSSLLRYVLAMNFAGWEVMEIFAGGVNESDRVFMQFVDMIAEVLGDDNASPSVRHQILQLAIIFTCSINQLSPGAYLLRRDLFPSIARFIKSPTTERFTFEASLLLSLLANFHKSDAAKLNPYLQRIRDTSDKELMRKICWASNFACDAAVKAYQEISDDSTPTFAKTVGSLIASLRPDRALAKQPVDPPRELFKNQPIEACVVLFPLFEFLFYNPNFTQIFLDSTCSPTDKALPTTGPPLHYTTLSLSSYLLTHASTSSPPRAMAYANLAMNILLVLSENSRVMEGFCTPSSEMIRLCRQRMPLLPLPTASRPLVCAVLDCCVLWLRHNLHRRLETSTYMTCIWTCHRILWYLQKVRLRLDYEWLELWTAIISLLAFLSSKLESLVTTNGVERLIQETIRLLDFLIRHAEMIMPRPSDIHELIYELVRSSNVLRKQVFLLQSLGQAGSTDRRVSLRSDSATKSLKHVLAVISYYEGQLSATNTRSAKDALRVVAKLIEKDGLGAMNESRDREDEPNKGEDVIGSIRCRYADCLALMP